MGEGKGGGDCNSICTLPLLPSHQGRGNHAVLPQFIQYRLRIIISNFKLSQIITPSVMLNPESVILNLVQNLFRAGLFQHLLEISYLETLKRPMKQVQGMVQGN